MQGSQNVGRFTAIKFNQGRALLHLAGMYPTLLEVILELVQNALDKDVRADRIWIVVNYKTRHLAVRDNGAGASIEKFNAALASVAEPGRKGEGSLGQFGIGLISALGKCQRFIFTSCPAPHKYGFQEWTFATDHIVEQRQDLTIPLRSRPDLTLDENVPKGKTRVSWRSEMSLIGFTDDSFMSRVPIDALIGGIQDRYATTMRHNKTVVSVEITDKDGHTERRPNVTAAEFRGRALPELTFESPDAGKTMFRLFVAPKTARRGRIGRVLMGVLGSDFRFPFHFFARSATELLKEEVVTALMSGLFEGEIISEKAKLHPSRKTLEKNDAFIGLCCAIEEWFDKSGQHCLDELKQCRQEQRFQELGLRSMKVLEQLLKDPAHAPLLDVIKSFGRGTVGIGHIDLRKKVVGEQAEPALSIDGKSGISRDEKPQGEPRDREKPDHEKPHVPLTVAGPKGHQRKVVKSSSFGLQFAHEAMEGSPELWRLDTSEGILIFNTRHPHWRACDVKDTTLMKLQECVAMEALTLYMMPENLRVQQRQVLDEFNHSLVSWILNSDKVRTPVGKKVPTISQS